ncbi:hypothetical protein R6Q59_004775 [Mikania micrantha]
MLVYKSLTFKVRQFMNLKGYGFPIFSEIIPGSLLWSAFIRGYYQGWLLICYIVCCDYHRDDHELLRKSFSLNSFGYSTSSVIAENEKSRTLLNELENQSNVVWCDQMCFSEIMKEASDIGCCFSSRIRHLVHLNSTTAIKKILKKYDISKLHAEHLEISHSPWLIELTAFYLNLNELNHMIDYKLCIPFSCDLTISSANHVLVQQDLF